MSARFEVVRTDAGHHARFIAANHRIVWTTENYQRKVGAENAIESITGRFISWYEGRASIAHDYGRRVEVRYIDTRLHQVAGPPLPDPSSL